MRREQMSIGNLTVDHCSLQNEPLGLFGQKYYVGGPNGSNGNSGLSKTSAFGTIQAAITAQIAYSQGYGDVIYVAPGTYAESLTGDLEDVTLIGCGSMPGAVRIRPTDGSAYRGIMTRAAIRNMLLANSSDSNPLYAALSITKMEDSLVDNCQIAGVNNAVESTTGIRIGTETTSVVYEMMWGSRISNCMWKHIGSQNNNVYAGIVFGLTGVKDEAASRNMMFSEICYNHIYAEAKGIELNITSANGGGASIHHNVVGSAQFNGNCSSYGIWATETGEEDQLVKVYFNHISASECIRNFKAGNVQGNWTSVGGAESTTEYPDTN